MNKYFKHTKKLLFLVATMVMMLATTLVVLGAVPSSEAAAKYSPLTILKVGTHTYDAKKDQYKYDAFGNKTIGTAKPVIYTNGYTAAEDDWMGNQPQFEVDLNGTDGFEMVELDNFIKLEVSARVGYDTNADGKVDAYTNGLYNVKSSNESVATVIQGTEPNWDNEGNEYESQYIIITAGKKAGTATIKLTEANPANPKKPKTATVKVTVKKLVDDIGFDADVVKADENDELYTEVGVKGKVTLGTTPTVDASKKTVKYVLDATAKNYISVSSKGVITAKKSTADLEGGYVTVRVVAQDMQYNYYNSRSQLKKATWGINETIKVYVADPTVKSAKILNVGFAKETTEANYKAGKAAQAYATIPMVTNVSSDAHTFKLQVAAYSGAKWSGAERVNAVRFTTSNAKVATVDKNGVITAKANGSATITVVPADGVALSGKEALKVTVKVTTDVEKIETANTDVETFAGKVYTIKANVNAGVSNAKAKGLAYEISSVVPADETVDPVAFKEHVINVSKATNVAKGKIRSDKEGKVVVRVYLKDAAVAAAHPDVEKYITINFVDPIKTITATVPVYKDIYKDKRQNLLYDSTPIVDSSKTTLYVDRTYTEVVENKVITKTVDDTCVIKTTVSKQFTGATNLDKVEATSSNTNVVKVLGKVEDGFEVQAVGKGTAKVTVAATDGSKVKKVVTITVVQKVNEINVANAAGGEIYLAPDNNGVTKTTFKAVTNADANNKSVTYTFIPNYKLMQGLGSIYGKLEKKTSSISLTKADNAILFPEGGNTDPVLLGKLTVTAKDALYFKLYAAPEVRHDALTKEINVYAVKQAKYVDSTNLATIVGNMVEAVADGEEGITLYKGEKLDLAAALEIPATITDRAVTWSVGVDKKDTDKNYISVKNGVVTAKKATVIGDTVTVRVAMKESATATIYEDVEVRVIPSQADFNSELNTQITALLKENDYTWLGAKPKFDAKKATLTLTISDVTMGKDAANAEMREKLTNVVKVFKDAAKVATYGTATEYTGLSVYDAVAGKTWTLQLVGANVVVFENNVEVGKYALAEVDAALDKLMTFITADVDDIVEWANKKLVVTLNADSTAVIPGTDRAEQYNTKYYTTQYTVAVAISEKDVEAFIDNKVANAVARFAVKNAGKEANTGIESVTYNADKNATLVEIYNGSVAIESVLPIVKADAVASLEDIFMNAVSAKVEIVDNENVRRFVEFNRNENSDVENLVAKLYAELTKELGANATMKDLEGIAVYATVDFDFAGTVYTKSYEVAFRRSVVAVDAEVDERINAFINGLEANPYGTIEYSDVDNMAIVTVTDYDATLQDAARAVVGKVEGFVNTLTSDAHAAKATINAMQVGESEDGIGKITATDILQVIKPDWYKPEAGGVSSRQLSELIGTTAVVEVTYDQGQVLYYIVKFQADYEQTNAKIAEAIDAPINEINGAEITAESIVFEASTESANTVVVAVNAAKGRETIDKLNGTGVYAVIEAILTEAEANCGKAVTLTAGKKSVAVELATNTLSVSEMIDKLAINTIGNLSNNPLNIAIELEDGRTINYVIKFVNADYEGGIKRNPLPVPMLEEGASSIIFETKVKAGKVVYYSGNIGEMIMTVTGKDAYVVYRGKTYTAVDGVVTVAIGEANMWNPATPAIGNLGKKDATYKVEFAYPVGHSMNPEAISDLSAFESYYEGTVEEGNSRGYSYAYKAVEDGTVTLWFAEVPADVEAYIEVNTTASYKVYTLDEDGVEDWKGDKFLTVPVKAEDILTIRVGAWPDENFVYPEMPYSLAATFAYPEGHESNPVDLGTIDVPDYGTSVKVTVPAGKTLWYQAKEIGGLVMTINNANGCTVSHDGATFEAVDGVVEFTLNMPMMYVRPVVFAITNGGETEATYTLELTYPLGSEQNPIMETPTRTATGYVLVLDVPAGEEVYYQAYNIGGMELTTATAEACTIIHAGNEFEAKDGVVELVLETPMPPYMPVSFGVRNNAEEDMTYRLVFAFPEGTQMNPIKISELDKEPSYYDGRVAEGGNGIYYTYTAEYTGNVLFSFAEHTQNVVGEIVVQNANSYKQLQLSTDAVNGVISMPVTEGDVLNISVGVLPAADWSYPAMGYSMAVAFEYPQESAQDPVAEVTE